MSGCTDDVLRVCQVGAGLQGSVFGAVRGRADPLQEIDVLTMYACTDDVWMY